MTHSKMDDVGRRLGPSSFGLTMGRWAPPILCSMGRYSLLVSKHGSKESSSLQRANDFASSLTANGLRQEKTSSQVFSRILGQHRDCDIGVELQKDLDGRPAGAARQVTIALNNLAPHHVIFSN